MQSITHQSEEVTRQDSVCSEVPGPSDQTRRVELKTLTVSPRAHENQKPSLHPTEGGAMPFLHPEGYLEISGWHCQRDGQHFGSLVCLVLALIYPDRFLSETPRRRSPDQDPAQIYHGSPLAHLCVSNWSWFLARLPVQVGVHIISKLSTAPGRLVSR